MARRAARIQLGRVAQGEYPAAERQIDRQAITVKELCALYLTDLNARLILGKGKQPKKQSTIDYAIAAQSIRLLALTGCRRSELTKLRWSEVDIENSCLSLEDSKEGKSVRPVGLHVIECLQQQHVSEARTPEKHRCYGTGPTYRKLGGRVVYAIDDLEA